MRWGELKKIGVAPAHVKLYILQLELSNGDSVPTFRLAKLPMATSCLLEELDSGVLHFNVIAWCLDGKFPRQ